MLNWAFARADVPRSATAMQLALAIRDEVADLEAAGCSIIQVRLHVRSATLFIYGFEQSPAPCMCYDSWPFVCRVVPCIKSASSLCDLVLHRFIAAGVSTPQRCWGRRKGIIVGSQSKQLVRQTTLVCKTLSFQAKLDNSDKGRLPQKPWLQSTVMPLRLLYFTSQVQTYSYMFKVLLAMQISRWNMQHTVYLSALVRILADRSILAEVCASPHK